MGMDVSTRFRLLSQEELATVSGAWHPFPHGLFGRDGKPFFGKDLAKGVAMAAPILGALFPPAAPILGPVGKVADGVVLAQRVKDAMDKK